MPSITTNRAFCRSANTCTLSFGSKQFRILCSCAAPRSLSTSLRQWMNAQLFFHNKASEQGVRDRTKRPHKETAQRDRTKRPTKKHGTDSRQCRIHSIRVPYMNSRSCRSLWKLETAAKIQARVTFLIIFTVGVSNPFLTVSEFTSLR